VLSGQRARDDVRQSRYPNTAPVVANQSVTIDEDMPSAIPLLVTDKENDPFTVTISTLPKLGTLVEHQRSIVTSGPITSLGRIRSCITLRR